MVSVLDKEGVADATLPGCFIQGSMRGYVYASESPWALKTTAEGLAIFEDLPDGATQIKVWQADQLVDIPPQPYTDDSIAGQAIHAVERGTASTPDLNAQTQKKSIAR